MGVVAAPADRDRYSGNRAVRTTPTHASRMKTHLAACRSTARLAQRVRPRSRETPGRRFASATAEINGSIRLDSPKIHPILGPTSGPTRHRAARRRPLPSGRTPCALMPCLLPGLRRSLHGSADNNTGRQRSRCNTRRNSLPNNESGDPWRLRVLPVSRNLDSDSSCQHHLEEGLNSGCRVVHFRTRKGAVGTPTSGITLLVTV
jgi:hypothetical protein